MIQAAPQHDAAWYYRTGNELYERKRFLDAQIMFDRACRLSPDNDVYAEAKDRLRIMAFSFGNWFSKKISSSTGNDKSFAECCGEACCEGCGECSCEICCESCCDSCDCDCG